MVGVIFTIDLDRLAKARRAKPAALEAEGQLGMFASPSGATQQVQVKQHVRRTKTGKAASVKPHQAKRKKAAPRETKMQRLRREAEDDVARRMREVFDDYIKTAAQHWADKQGLWWYRRQPNRKLGPGVLQVFVGRPKDKPSPNVVRPMVPRSEAATLMDAERDLVWRGVNARLARLGAARLGNRLDHLGALSAQQMAAIEQSEADIGAEIGQVMREALRVRGEDPDALMPSWRDVLWTDRILDLRYNVWSHKATDDNHSPFRQLEDEWHDIRLVAAVNGELPGDHWGAVTADNAMARGVAWSSGDGILRPHDDFEHPVDIAPTPVERYVGEARRAYAQRRLRGCPRSDNKPNGFSMTYRGMLVPTALHDALRNASESGATVPLTGCTSVTPSEEIARKYAASEWSRHKSAPGSLPLVMEIERDATFDRSIGMWHNKDGQPDGLPFELVSGAPAMSVVSYQPATRWEPAVARVRFVGAS